MFSMKKTTSADGQMLKCQISAAPPRPSARAAAAGRSPPGRRVRPTSSSDAGAVGDDVMS